MERVSSVVSSAPELFVVGLREDIIKNSTNAVFDVLCKLMSDKDFLTFLEENKSLDPENIVRYNHLLHGKLRSAGIVTSPRTDDYSDRELCEIMFSLSFLAAPEVYDLLRCNLLKKEKEFATLLSNKKEFSDEFRKLIAFIIARCISESDQFFVNVRDINERVNDEKKKLNRKVLNLELERDYLQKELSKYKEASKLSTQPSFTGEKDQFMVLKRAENRLKGKVSDLELKLGDLERYNDNLKSEIEEYKYSLSREKAHAEYYLSLKEAQAEYLYDLESELEISDSFGDRASHKYREVFTQNAELKDKNFGLEEKVSKLEKQVSDLNEEKEYLVGLIKCFAQQKQDSNKTSNLNNKFNYDTIDSRTKQRSHSSSK